MFHVVLPISPYILEILFLKDNISVHPWLQQYSSSPQSLGFESRIACSFPSGPAPCCAAPLKALVWFWLIDETLSANLVHQGDYEIGSTTPSDEAVVKIMTMVMAW